MLVYVVSGCVQFGNLNSKNFATQCNTEGQWMWVLSKDPYWDLCNPDGQGIDDWNPSTCNNGIHLYS